MQVALKTCRNVDLHKAETAAECLSNDATHWSCNGSDRHSWTWLVGVSEASCSVVDVSDNSAHVLEFFGRWEPDGCTLPWKAVCRGLLGSAGAEELKHASHERSKQSVEGRDETSSGNSSVAHPVWQHEEV
jgi:hypothetical protein